MNTIKQKVIESCNDLENLMKVKLDFIDEKHLFKVKKYPQIGFKISKREAEEINAKSISLLDEVQKEDHSPLEKLMLAILWKNGDLEKEKHIIESILESTGFKDKTSGHIFYQFGKHLSDPENQSIIDQHILRAFLFGNTKSEDLGRIRSKKQLSKNDAEDIEGYIQWVTAQTKRIEGDGKKFFIKSTKFFLPSENLSNCSTKYFVPGTQY